MCLKVTKSPFLQLIPCIISNLLPQGHIVGNFEITLAYLTLIESQKFFFDNLKAYSAMGNLVSQLDTPFSVLAVKDVLIFRMLHDIFTNHLLNCDETWQSCFYSRWVVESTSTCSWKIGIANPPYLVGKGSNFHSFSLHVRPPVIVAMSWFQMVVSIGSNKWLILGIVFMK